MLQTFSCVDALETATALDLALLAMADETDLDVSSGHISGECSTQLISAASDRPLPETRAPSSVFDLADISRFGWLGAVRKAGQTAAKPPPIQERVHTVITRDFGLIRCKRLHHTETVEWKEQEAARRARQIVPRPQAKYKTKGENLKQLAPAW